MSPSESIVSLLKTERITHISLVEKQFSELLQNKTINDNISDLKAILVGGSAVSSKLIEDAYNREWRIHTTYGSTELCSQVATTRPKADLKMLKTSGNLLKYRELRLAENGEILLRGETLSPGYLRAGKLTDIRDEEGWYVSGDLGMIDERGLLHIKGRIDNMFISGGENIYPEVIERTVKALPAVINALVVPLPDDRYGYRPALFLQMTRAELPSVKEIKAMLDDKLAAYMLPDYVLPWPQKTAKNSIKISRKYFKELAEKRIR
jgi:O-succinylbenzoic acid--CoA ligase